MADYHEALEWFERTAERDSMIRALAQQHARPRLEIEYDKICLAPEVTLDFLHLARAPLVSVYKKQRSGSQAALIENYEKLRSQFSGTAWDCYFTDRETI